jgi:hypothetical protein
MCIQRPIKPRIWHGPRCGGHHPRHLRWHGPRSRRHHPWYLGCLQLLGMHPRPIWIRSSRYRSRICWPGVKKPYCRYSRGFFVWVLPASSDYVMAISSASLFRLQPMNHGQCQHHPHQSWRCHCRSLKCNKKAQHHTTMQELTFGTLYIKTLERAKP